MSTPETAAPAALLVPEDHRPDFLPRLFGRHFLLLGEMMVYRHMETLSPQDYRGGYWNFYELAGAPLYLAPASKPRYHITCEGNGYEGELSADAAGIIATLFAASHLSFRRDAHLLPDIYGPLYAYAIDHPEAAEILQAID